MYHCLFSAAVKGKKQSVHNSNVLLVEEQWNASLFDEINQNNGYDASTTVSKDEKIQKTVYTITILVLCINTIALIKYHNSNKF